MWVALTACAALLFTPFASPRHTGPGVLHIHSLAGAIQRAGSYRGTPLYAVRIRATVCFRSAQEALKTYPTEFRITHYAVVRSGNKWWRARDVRDNPHWLVPFGETWNGRACGPVSVEDPIPITHTNLHSLGNELECYGVAFGIKAGRAQARRRVIVKCGKRF